MSNTTKYSVAGKQIFPDIKALVDSTISFFQGDLMFYDASAKLVKPVSSGTEGSMATLIGIATENIFQGKPFTPYPGTLVDAAQATPALNGPMYGIVAEFTLATGSTLNPGDPVYALPASGSQFVATTGTQAIGVYEGKLISSSSAGQKVEVLVGARYPSGNLQF